MDPIFIIILISLIGRTSVIFKKKVLNITKQDEPLTIVWFIYFFSLLILTIYLLYKDNNPIKLLANKNSSWLKWTLLAAITSVLYSVISTPLLKQLNYSLYSAIKSPISIVIAIIASILFLGEKPSKNIYVAVGLYILAAIVANSNFFN